MYLYHRIRDLREDHDKTQRDVAKYLNMQLTVISDMNGAKGSCRFGRQSSWRIIIGSHWIILWDSRTIRNDIRSFPAHIFNHRTWRLHGNGKEERLDGRSSFIFFFMDCMNRDSVVY